MDCHLGYFGDKRLESVGSKMFSKMISLCRISILKLSLNRAEQMQFNRFLANKKVSLKELQTTALSSTADNACQIEHILSIQDTTEFNFENHLEKKADLGYVSNSQKGCFVHPAIAIDPRDGCVIG